MGLCPDMVIEAQIRYLKEFESNTTQGLSEAWGRLWTVHESLGRFIGARPEDLFLRPNVTTAFNELLMGLKLPPGCEILTTNFEYGAIVQSLELKVQRENLKLRSLDLGFIHEVKTTTEFVEKIAEQLSSGTRLFVVSHIFTGNGIEVPIQELARELLKHDVLLMVDGAHTAGLIPMDFKAYPDVAFYAGNLHKWAMGPKGTGFAWVQERFQKYVEPVYGS